MIYYNPTNGDPHSARVEYRPKTCFLMTKLGYPVSDDLQVIQTKLSTLLSSKNIDVVDAESIVTGRDFLFKIWSIVISVPLGVAIINEEMSPQTLSNIFYEVGLMQAYGKETLVVKTPATSVPSDFVRTEYVEFDDKFDTKIEKFLHYFVGQADYYAKAADQLQNNPLLAIDYLRRAYLISGENQLRERARQIFEDASIEARAKNSVEMLLVDF